jgi:hypothetical protein
MSVGSVVGTDEHLSGARGAGGVIAYEEHVLISCTCCNIGCNNMAMQLDVPHADSATASAQSVGSEFHTSPADHRITSRISR